LSIKQAAFHSGLYFYIKRRENQPFFPGINNLFMVTKIPPSEGEYLVFLAPSDHNGWSRSPRTSNQRLSLRAANGGVAIRNFPETFFVFSRL
jgi:hypothetical protein